MYFPVQRVQTDRGREFFVHEVRCSDGSWIGASRSANPATVTALEREVERSQKTDLDEFWSSVDLKDPELTEKTRRPHSALDRRTPDAVYFDSLPLAAAA